jgi:ribose 5-phosphate isomerase B
MMKIAISADISGVKLKEAIKGHLVSLSYDVYDLDQNENDKVFYWEAASKVAQAIQQGVCEKGVLCCGTGAGVSIVANKFKGIWAVACESIFTGERCSIINNANIITLGGRVVGETNACQIVEKWLSKKFSEGLDANSQEIVSNGLNKLKEIEDQNFKAS